MGLDVSRPSREYTELYLPADTFRVCNPRERCWCDRGSHRDSRYYYVERGGDGRERYHDPFDYMDRFMMGGGWPMPWKDVRQWSTRDFDRLGEIMSEYNSRLRGQQMGEWNNLPSWMSMMPAMMMADELRSSCSPRRHHRSHRSGHSGYDGIMNNADRIIRSHGQRLNDLEADCYGTEGQLKEEQYKRRQMKLWEEFTQRMNGGTYGMNAMGGMGMPGIMNPNMGMGMGGMMPQQYGAMGGVPGMAAMGGAPNMAGMGAMGGMNSMNGMMPGAGMGAMNGFGDEMMSGGLGGAGRRNGFGRAGRRRGLTMADDLDDDFDDLLGGRSRRRRPGRRWGDHRGDLDDELGGIDGSPLPRNPGGPRRGPNGPDDILGGGGGVVFENEVEAARNFRSRPVSGRSSSDIGMPSTGAEYGIDPILDIGVSSPPPPGLRSHQPTAMGPGAQDSIRMPPAGTIPGMAGSAYQDFASYNYGVSPRTAHLPSAFAGRGPSRPERNVSFPSGQGMSRPRTEEDNRGETAAGGTADKRRDA